MSNDFADRMRKAAGVPTAADKQAAADKRSAEQALWERDEPKRQEALAHFNTIVVPMILDCADTARKVVQEVPGLSVTEVRYMPAADRETLSLKTFHLQRGSQQTASGSRGVLQLPQTASTIGTLHITLTTTGLLHLEVPVDNRIGMLPSTKGLPIRDIQQSHIENAFLQLVAKMNK